MSEDPQGDLETSRCSEMIKILSLGKKGRKAVSHKRVRNGVSLF